MTPPKLHRLALLRCPVWNRPDIPLRMSFPSSTISSEEESASRGQVHNMTPVHRDSLLRSVAPMHDLGVSLRAPLPPPAINPEDESMSAESKDESLEMVHQPRAQGDNGIGVTTRSIDITLAQNKCPQLQAQSTTTIQHRAPFRFEALPAEIRLMVYELAMEPLIKHVDNSYWEETIAITQQCFECLALMQTNKSIHHEFKQHFFRQARIFIDINIYHWDEFEYDQPRIQFCKYEVNREQTTFMKLFQDITIGSIDIWITLSVYDYGISVKPFNNTCQKVEQVVKYLKSAYKFYELTIQFHMDDEIGWDAYFDQIITILPLFHSLHDVEALGVIKHWPQVDPETGVWLGEEGKTEGDPEKYCKMHPEKLVQLETAEDDLLDSITFDEERW